MTISLPTFVPDPLCHVPINPNLNCSEEWATLSDYENVEEDDDDWFYRQCPITFRIRLPGTIPTLNFYCRDKSSGVLLPNEPAVSESTDKTHNSDPFFFEKGFYLEAQTGFQPWPGSRFMIEAFTCDLAKKNNDNNNISHRMEYWQTRLKNKDLTILEVGAGIGVVGTCLAAAGAKVLVTDLPVLVEHAIWPNMKRNGTPITDAKSLLSAEVEYFPTFAESLGCSRIGNGWAQAMVLDWLKPIPEQLSQEVADSLDLIVACDCLFLRKLIDPLLGHIVTLFSSCKKRPIFLFTYQRRNLMGVFITIEELLNRMEQLDWNVKCLAWRTIAVEGDSNHDLHLFEASPRNWEYIQTKL